MTSIFPVSASVGQEFSGYNFDGESWNLIGNEFNPTSFSSSPPLNPKAGDLWVDSSSDVPSISPESILTKNSASTIYLSQVSASNTYANMTTTPISGFRNVIINGGFDINQRNSSSYSIPGSYESFPYTLDRWQAYRGGTGGTYTVSSVASISGEIPNNEFKQFMRYQCTSAQTGTADVQIRQAIEDVRSVSNGTFILSFWARAASATNIGVFYEQNFGTGGSTPVTSSPTTISIETTWSRYSVIWNPESISGKTISATDSKFYVYFTPPTLSTFTLDFWGVQLERGLVATPFEQRPISIELALCQRYYESISYPVHYAAALNGTDIYLPVYFKIRKRGTPNVTLPSATNAIKNTSNTNATPIYAWVVPTASVDSFTIYAGSDSIWAINSGIAIASAEL